LNQLVVELGERSYPIIIENKGLNRIGGLFLEREIGKRVVVISDNIVAGLYAETAIDHLEWAGFEVTLLTFPAGEKSKNLKTVDRLFEQMISAKIDRRSTVVAFGGGVVGDVAGFVAATYLRSIQLVQIPTTLLSQTDSSVGGKVGVNHRLGKNMIGAIYQPKFVLIDPLVLRTLESREVFSGLGEVLKYGLIWDRQFFYEIGEKICQNQNRLDVESIEQLIQPCCRIKAAVVASDEKEWGLRRILNFGHTIGHALEAVTNYKYFRHGEAVLLGMKAMLYLSFRRHLLDESAFASATKILNLIPVPKIPRVLTSDKILDQLQVDKKNVAGKIVAILLDGIGRAMIEEDCSKAQISEAVNYLLEKYQE